MFIDKHTAPTLPKDTFTNQYCFNSILSPNLEGSKDLPSGRKGPSVRINKSQVKAVAASPNYMGIKFPIPLNPFPYVTNLQQETLKISRQICMNISINESIIKK